MTAARNKYENFCNRRFAPVLWRAGGKAHGYIRRPLANHAEKLKQHWLSAVRPQDAVIICGDISWGLRIEEAAADFKWISELPGKKIIFKGNHDLWWQSAGKLNRLYGDGNMIFIQNGAYLLEENGQKVAVCGSRGWICPGADEFSENDRKIYKREMLRLKMSLEEAAKLKADKIVAALHFPPTNDKMQSSGFTELLTQYGVDRCVYGHLHGKEAFKKGLQGSFNGVGYELVSLDYLEACPKEVIL